MAVQKALLGKDGFTREYHKLIAENVDYTTGTIDQYYLAFKSGKDMLLGRDGQRYMVRVPVPPHYKEKGYLAGKAAPVLHDATDILDDSWKEPPAIEADGVVEDA